MYYTALTAKEVTVGDRVYCDSVVEAFEALTPQSKIHRFIIIHVAPWIHSIMLFLFV